MRFSKQVNNDINFSRIVWKKGKDNRLHSPFVHLKCKFEIYLWEKASPLSPFRPRDYSTSNCAIFRACNSSIPCVYLLLHDAAELLKMSSMYHVLFKLITAVKHLSIFYLSEVCMSPFQLFSRILCSDDAGCKNDFRNLYYHLPNPLFCPNNISSYMTQPNSWKCPQSITCFLMAAVKHFKLFERLPDFQSYSG